MIKQEDNNIPVMFYPQVEGITPTVVEPCTDAISREAVAEVLLKYAHSTEGKAFAEFLISQINALPPVTAEKPNKWIPVSERYPTDTSKSYLVCYEDGCITIEDLYFGFDFDGNGYPFFSEMELGVVAWMPLPEPYKQEVEE